MSIDSYAVTIASGSATPPPWRVAVTRDEGRDGPLTQALKAEQFVPVACPVLVEVPPADADAVVDAAARLDDYAWIVCASARAVRALAAARGRSWPRAVRTAAVGAGTAAALRRHGAAPPLVADGDGAEALWTALRTADAWPGRRVLVATTPGGRRTLIEALTTAGADIDTVEAYRMEARPAVAIATDWAAAAPEAAIVASPRVAEALVAAVGATALTGLRGVVAIGETTARALTNAGVAHVVADQADFRATARALAAVRLAEAPR